MSDFAKRLAALTPERRRLLLQKVQEKKNSARETFISPLASQRQKKTSNMFPLSFAQERLWFLDQLDPENAFYNMPFRFLLQGRLHLEALSRSLTSLITRHEILHTTFPCVENQPVQMLAAIPQNALSLIDLQGLSEPLQEQVCQDLLRQEAHRPFDLAQSPLFRSYLLRLAPEKHLLALTMHHIISDGWSIAIIYNELWQYYRAQVTQQSLVLPELPIQYADFAMWQREWLQEAVLQDQLHYWKSQFAGAPTSLDLPTDHPRPAVQRFQGASIPLQLSAHLSQSLLSLSLQQGVTLFMTLLAAFQVLLMRYSGQEDIVIGATIANRNRVETERLIGFFVNTLVLRTRLDGNPRFQDLLSQVRETTLDAYDHQDLPFEKLVEELHPDRDLSRNPLFQVMFAFQNTPLQSEEAQQELGLTITSLETVTTTAKFDLTLALMETAGGLVGDLEYNSDLFEEGTIQRMAEHFQVLLQGVVADPTQSIQKLPLLTEREQVQLLQEWTATAQVYPRWQCVHHLFEAQVTRTPDAIAAVCEEQCLSYAELNRRANQLAHQLRVVGVGPEVLVGVCVHRSLEMLIGILGVLKAGGAYVPLDPTYPQERLAFMLRDAQISILLTQHTCASLLEEQVEHLFFLDAYPEGHHPDTFSNLLTPVTVDNLLYMIYTSGSTGRPKGVSNTHAATLNRLHWMWTTYPFAEDEVCCQKTSLNFVDSIWEIFGPLLRGYRIVIIPDATVKDPFSLITCLTASAITRIVLVPSLLQSLIEICNHVPKPLPRLQWWTCSGEALPLELVHRFQSIFSERKLLNLYGSSEVAADATVCELTRWETDLPSILIGTPIANTQCYILDSDRQLAPIGVPGELYIGGAGLARGYFHLPDLTAERFVPNPFAHQPGERLYRTGDLARFRPDGNIEYLGRLDTQVKLRGFRIELKEIEATLMQYPGIRQVAVGLHEYSFEDKRLVAYIQVEKQDEQRALEPWRLQNYLQERLPAYMVPAAFVQLETFPLTPNGKLDWRAFPAPELTIDSFKSMHSSPRDLLELQILQIWEEIIRNTSIGIKDDFFELGGHSILAVNLLNQIQKRFTKHIPLATFFRNPTVEYIACIIREHATKVPWSPLIGIQPYGSNRPFFCVHPGGGDPSCYYYLAQYLGREQPLYGLQAKGLYEDQIPEIRVEVMAETYIEAIRSIQPEGPYVLGGWSMGGTVAFEMAQQLQRQGQKVDLLVLFDTHASWLEPIDIDDADLWTVFFKDLNLSDVFLRQLDFDQQVAFVLEKARDANLLLPGTMDLFFARNFLVYKNNLLAVKDYIPQPYRGKAILFYAGEPGKENARDPLNWNAVIEGGLETHTINAEHGTIIFDPHIQIVAKILKDAL